MKTYFSLLFILLATSSVLAQIPQENLQYEPSATNPWGLPNPSTPEVLDFKEMIGTCDCKSISRNPDQTWADTTAMLWKFKYIMNGTAVQDEVWRENGRYAGGIRQFQPDSGQWVVSYFSNPGTPWNPGVWHGKRIDNAIALYKDSPSPSGTPGDFRITFYDLKKTGFSWKGEWVDKAETIVYPTWMIYCTKREI